MLKITFYHSRHSVCLCHNTTGSRWDSHAPNRTRVAYESAGRHKPRWLKPGRSWPEPLCQTEHVDCAAYSCFCDLHRNKLIMNAGCRASQIADLINLHIQRKSDAIPHQFKMRLSSNCMMFLSFPVKKLSTQRTSWPSFNRHSQRCEPRKPAPPVTRTRFQFEVSCSLPLYLGTVPVISVAQTIPQAVFRLPAQAGYLPSIQ